MATQDKIYGHEVPLIWLLRGVCAVLMFYTIHVIWKSHSTWKSNDSKERETQYRATCINGISLCCFCLVLIIIIISSFPGPCDYMNGFWFITWSISKGFLLISETMRLQGLAPRQNAAYSKGYPKYVFYTLYAIIILYTLYTVIVSPFTFNMKVIDNLPLCVEQINASFTKYQAPAIIIDIIVQLTILCLFMTELSKIKSYMEKYMPQDDQVLSTLEAALDKLIILECTLLTITVGQWLIYAIQTLVPPFWQLLLITLVHIYGAWVCVVIAFFMIKRNGSIYHNWAEKFVQILCLRVTENRRNQGIAPNGRRPGNNTGRRGNNATVQLMVTDTRERVESTTGTQRQHPLSQPRTEGNESPISPEHVNDPTEVIMMNQTNHRH